MAENADKIKGVLKNLNHQDDDLWTAEGLPKVNVIADLVGASVTRKDITDADPQFLRKVEDAEEIDEFDDTNKVEVNGEGIQNLVGTKPETEGKDVDGNVTSEKVIPDEPAVGDNKLDLKVDVSVGGQSDLHGEDVEGNVTTEKVVPGEVAPGDIPGDDGDDRDDDLYDPKTGKPISGTEEDIVQRHNDLVDETLEELDEEIAELEEQEKQYFKIKGELELRYAQLRVALDPLLTKRDNLIKKTNPSDNTAFIAAQNKLRAQKAGLRETVLGKIGGLTTDDLDPRSPLDKSFARKTGHGHGRKKFF